MFRLLLAFLLLIPTNGFCVTQWDKSLPSSGANLTAFPAAVNSQWSILDTLVSNYRQGETLIFKNSTTLTVTLGQVVVSNSGATLRIFLSDSGNTDITSANLDSGGSFGNSTTYYVYAAATSSTAASSTYYISASSSAPTGPTYYLQIGSFITDGSGNVQTITNLNAIPSVSASNGTSFSTNTAYQNTSNKKLIVSWTGAGQCSGGWCGVNEYGSIGSTNSVGTVVSGWHMQYASTPTMSLISSSFEVPAGYWWEVVNAASSGGGGSLTGSVSRIETWNIN